MSWAQLGSDIIGSASGDQSGFSVSISADGTVVAIGAPYNDSGGADRGQVRIYKWSGSAWVQRGQDIIGQAAGDYGGRSVSLSADGTVVAIGAPYNDSGGNLAGNVRVFDWTSPNWVQRGQDINGGAAEDQSGFSVSLSADGNVVAIGAPYFNTNPGRVRIYIWSSPNWNQQGQDIIGPGVADVNGWSVSLSANGNVVAIGAIGGAGIGYVRMYILDGSTWLQRGSTIDGATFGEEFGWSVSLSADGNVVAIGASDDNGYAGSVRIYDWISPNWVKRGADINGSAGGQAGYSVSLSADGSIVVIGEPYTGGGRVRIYEWVSPNWIQRGANINSSAGDRAGFSVSFSADATTVAFGAIYSNALAGAVRIFTFQPPAPSAPQVAAVQSSSERLRRRMEIQPKVIAPRPIRDSSSFTQRLRFAASRRASNQSRLSDGGGVIPSSEYVVSATAGCAVCNDPPQVTSTTVCCPDNYNPSPAPVALQPSCTPCGVPAGPQPVSECCPPGNRVNTWYATDIDPTIYIPPTCNPCVVPGEPAPNCCDENGFLLPQ
jgi:hypothetical protein